MNAFDTCAPSPCVRNCCLDDDLTCLGCFRSLEEIKEWTVVDAERRRIILQNARQRKDAFQSRHPMPDSALAKQGAGTRR